ncbi:MAG: RnfABCDGE type electron transport complex subunit G [Candidatus Flemingiibacterium sp.]
MTDQKNQEKKPDAEIEANNSNSPEKKSSDVRFILGIALKLLIISAVTALLLAGVNALTAPRIAENNELEKKNAIAAIFPSSDDCQLTDISADGVELVYLVLKDGDLLGYAASVSTMGFGGEIELMVGVTAEGTVRGIKVVSHSETPGLGSRVDDEGYLSQYAGLGGNLSIGSDVDAITGSTISSKAVLRGVNAALSAYSAIFTENDEIGGLE